MKVKSFYWDIIGQEDEMVVMVAPESKKFKLPNMTTRNYKEASPEKRLAFLRRRLRTRFKHLRG